LIWDWGLLVINPVLALDDVSIGFERGRDWLWVFEEVSLTVRAGELAAVVGSRDQGKTTLLRVAAGVLPANRGSVRVEGREIGGLKDRQLSRLLRSDIGLATRDGPVAPWTVRDYVELQLGSNRRFGRRECRQRVTAVLKDLEVADCAELRWKELSNWQRVRVELAQAIVRKPKVLLVDSLLDGLGFGKVQEAKEILRDLADDSGCGVLMACSDFLAASGSDRVWQLAAGRLKVMSDEPLAFDHSDQTRRTRRGGS
jgi:putative ABC transport system ATP-binding protein